MSGFEIGFLVVVGLLLAPIVAVGLWRWWKMCWEIL